MQDRFHALLNTPRIINVSVPEHLAFSSPDLSAHLSLTLPFASSCFPSLVPRMSDFVLSAALPSPRSLQGLSTS